MKMKNKRLLTRVLVVCSMVLLLSVLAIPCFALEPPTEPVPPTWPSLNPPGVNTVLSRDQLYDMFNYAYQLNSDDALYRLINSSYWVFAQLPYVYQFNGVAVGQRVVMDEPLTFNDIVGRNSMLFVYDPSSGDELIATWGHWRTQYSTSGDNRIMMIKFYEYDQLTDAYTDILTIRVRYDRNTRIVTESTVYSDVYTWIDGLFNSYSIATATDIPESCVMQYALSTGYLHFDVAQNMDTFFDGVYEGFPYGWRYGYLTGWDNGGQEWYAWGLYEGYNEGLADGGNTATYEQGYQDAVDDINSGDFGKNLLGNAFSAPFDALSKFTIVSWTTSSGAEISVTLGTVLSAFIGVTLFIWFLKLFAGG